MKWRMGRGSRSRMIVNAIPMALASFVYRFCPTGSPANVGATDIRSRVEIALDLLCCSFLKRFKLFNRSGEPGE